MAIPDSLQDGPRNTTYSVMIFRSSRVSGGQSTRRGCFAATIKHDLCAQMAKLMRRKHNSGTPSEVALDKQGNHRLTLRGPVGIYKDTLPMPGPVPSSFGAMRSRYSISNLTT